MSAPVDSDDCRSCGACCGPPYPFDRYIDLTQIDLARLSPRDRRAFVCGGDSPALATTVTDDGAVCVALRGRIGQAVACAIYERRPGACRRFRPGSAACLRMRDAAGL
jgi:Fe-S-cluster containining protein